MSEDPPIIVIGIALILVAIAVIALRSRGKLKQPITRNRKSFFSLFVIGLVLALTAAFLMFDGDMLGENTTGIATAIGIVGIGLIAISNFALLKR
jgi:multisubunit Na+/H+ antiporter MnhB subunit